MPALFRSLYARIAIVYLLLLVSLCAICSWLIVVNGNRFVAEMEQRFNLMLAADIAAQLAQPLTTDLNGQAMRRAVQQITNFNHSLSLYVLDQRGKVLATFSCPQALGRTLTMQPLLAFINASATLPVRGEDPCNGQSHKIFSAAPVDLGVQGKGYLYVILDSPLNASQASRIRGSYILRTLGLIALAALLVTGVVGLILFAWLTRRFRRLTNSVHRFKAGEYDAIVEDTSGDEIGDLARAFNAMAARIRQQIEALEQTDSMRRDLIANISHDFRTPLTSLRGYAERLSGTKTMNEHEHQAHLKHMHASIAQLTQLADSLSVLSQLDAHEAAVRFEPFSLAELIQDICAKFQPQAQQSGIALTAVQPLADGDVTHVSADIALIERAISNLVENALASTDLGGEVQLKLETGTNHVSVTVRDNGAGIAEEELELVTQRFYRTQASRSQGRSGSGLGLAIAREIAELHGGTLLLQSQPGKGSQIGIRLLLVP